VWQIDGLADACMGTSVAMVCISCIRCGLKLGKKNLIKSVILLKVTCFADCLCIVHDCAVLDLTGGDTGSVHKQRSSVIDVMSPPLSAFCMLGAESSSTPACAPPPPSFQTELPTSDGLMCGSVHKSFHWPGIDAVMESYQLYLEGAMCVSLLGLYWIRFFKIWLEQEPDL